MTYQKPPRRELKFLAKRLILHPTCLRVTLLLVSIQIGLFAVRSLLGGTMTYNLVDLAEYGSTASGIYFTASGFNLIFRMDLTQTLMAISLTYKQIAAIVLSNLLVFFVLSPLRLGAMEQYWRVSRQENPVVRDALTWFKEKRRFGKALVVEFVVLPLTRLAALVATIPSLYLFYLFYTTTPSLEAYNNTSALLQMSASLLAIAAAVFAFWLHSLLLPIRYCLAAHPEYSLKMVFQRGMLSAKGFRKGFFGFRLTFIPWFFFSQLTYGALDFFVTPYTSLSGMLYLQEAARIRQAPAAAQHVPSDQDSALPPQ